MSTSHGGDMISLLERYLLAVDKEAFFTTLVKGSGTYERMRVLDHLSRYGLKVPADTQAAVEELLHSSRDRTTTLASFKTQLLQIAVDHDEKKRKKRMGNFNDDFLRCGFDHRRPANVKQSDRLADNGADAGLPTEFNCTVALSLRNVVEQVMCDADREIKDLRSPYYHRYSLPDVLSRRRLDDFEHVLRSLQTYTHVTNLCAVLEQYGQQWRAHHRTVNGVVSLLTQDVYRKMTLAQLEEFERTVPDAKGHPLVVASKFEKVFEADLESVANTDTEPAARRTTLGRMLAWVDSQPSNESSRSFCAQVLREILETDLEMNHVDEGVFLQYVSNPLGHEGGVYVDPRPGVTPVRPVPLWYNVHQFPRARWHRTEEALLSACLQRLLAEPTRAGKLLESYAQKLHGEFLTREYCRARLLSCGEAADASKVFTESELNRLREERRLRFVPWNRQRFLPGERVDLLLEVKNVDNITVSVFEIDTESYYRTHSDAVDSRVEVTGLIPSKRIEQPLNNPPIMSQIVEFKDLFNARRGVYVVEFVGGGLSSRAVVRVGGLTVVQQVLSKGVLLHIVDESRRICNGQRTGLVVDGRMMRSQESLGGGILVPYADRARQENGVLMHDGFAQPYRLSVPAEDVRFSFGLLVNEESVAVGGVVRFALVPQVVVNGRRVRLTSLHKVRAHVTSVSDEQVSNVTTFDDVKLDPRGKSVALDYLVPPKTERVEVRLTAEFYSSAREKYIDLSCERTIRVDGKRGEKVFYNYYLSQDSASGGADFVLELLGKNGEPYAKQRVKLALVPVYASRNLDVICETDAEGRVRLVGARDVISTVSAESVDAPSVVPARNVGVIRSADKVDNVPPMYDVVEGEELLLPLCQRDGTFDAQRYELVRMTRVGTESVVEDLSARIRSADGALSICDLTEGVYRFRYREAGGGKSVRVHVVRGKRWAAAPSAYVETSQGIRRLVNRGLLSLSMRGYRLDPSSGAVEVRVMSQDASSVEVHAFAFSYYPQTLALLREQLATARNPDIAEEFVLSTSRSQYLSEKFVGDEVKYVLERQRKKAYMGSTLEKPPALLQRHFVRDTTEEAEDLRTAKDFSDCVNEEVDCIMAEKTMLSQERKMCREVPMGVPLSDDSIAVTRLNTFLASAGWSAVCCSPEEGSDVVRLQVPMDAGYSTLVLIARDGHGSVMETHALPVNSPPRADVRLANSKSAGRVYVQERSAHCLKGGDVYEAKDASSTDLHVVDNVATLLKVQRALSMNAALDEWGFLGEWGSLTPLERLHKYDKYACHELNVFVYFKDREFFECVVRPHLLCKTHKGVVDAFLLGDVAALEACLQDTARVSALDVLERTLLVAALSERHRTECAAIARGAREALGPECERDLQLYNRLFDSVLNGREPEVAVSMPPPPCVAAPIPNVGALFAKNAKRNASAARCFVDRSEEDCKLLMMEDCLGGDSVPPINTMNIRKYREVGTTNEYVEKQYYSGRQFDAQLNWFWADALTHFAECGEARPLLTANFMYATGNTAEMVLAAALLGVGMEKPTHSTGNVGQALRLVAGGSSIVFSREICEKGAERVDLDVLATQRMVDPQDLYTTVGGTRVLKSVTEFLVGKLYSSRVVVTNATESELRLSLVTEVPQGAVPVVKLEYTGNEQLVMAPLSTRTHEFYFYFPAVGEYTFFPASVNKDGKLVVTAKCAAGPLRVVRTHTTAQMETISDILNQGSKDDILAFMERENLRKADVFTFDAIYWLLKDAEFYRSVVALLRRKKHFDPTVWSYSIVHGDCEAFREFLGWRYQQNPLRLFCLDGNAMERVQYVECALLHMDVFEYREYNPLVNTRAHDVGENTHNIRNRQFRETYEEFLRYLFQKTPALTLRDYVYWCTYLLLQDRVDEALRLHSEHIAGRTGSEAEDLRLQQDYLKAYLSLYTDAPGFGVAREIATRYLTYPVFTWRNRFVEVLNRVVDADAPAVPKAGGEDAVTDADRNTAQAQSEPYLSCELDGQQVRVTVGNVGSICVRFYRVDLELLFSQNPFLDMATMDYSYVTANRTLELPVKASSPQLAVQSVAIPDDLASSNLIVQVGSGALVSSVTYFPNKMSVFVNRNYGQVRVLDTASGAPLSLVYVKAFARRNNGEVSFFKDGYTDLRGMFEYASAQGATGKLDSVDEFSLLVLSETAGAVLKRTKPPSRTAEVSFGAAPVRSAALQQLHDRMVGESKSKYCL